MNLLKFFSRNRGSAPVARERLQILLAHERSSLGQSSNLLDTLREEILAVIARHVALDPEKVQVKMDSGGTVSTLEVDIEIPREATALALTGT
jgi:cell division topological specificity factor